MGIIIIGLLAALIIPPVVQIKSNSKEKQRMEQEGHLFHIGDTVYMDGMDITGRVNTVYSPACAGVVDLLVKNSDGTVSVIKYVNSTLLNKVPTSEK